MAVFIIITLYIGLLTILHIPYFQEKIGAAVASRLSDYLNTEVKIGRIDLGLLNQAIVSDIILYDQSGENAINIDKASARIEPVALLRGDINLSSIQLFNLSANIYRKTPNSQLNIQFIIDKLKSKSSKEEKKSKLKVGTIVLRNSCLRYQVLSNTSGNNQEQQFNVNDILFDNINLVTRINKIANDTIDIDVENLSFDEKKCGFRLDNLKTSILSLPDEIKLGNTEIISRNSFISSDELAIKHPSDKGQMEINGNIRNSTITPSDFSCFLRKLTAFNTPFRINTNFDYSHSIVTLNGMEFGTVDNGLDIQGDFMLSALTEKYPEVEAKFRTLKVKCLFLAPYLKAFNVSQNVNQILSKLDYVEGNGVFSYKHPQTTCRAILNSLPGKLSIDGTFDNNRLQAHISTPSFHITELSPEMKIKDIGMDLDVETDFSAPKKKLAAKGFISHILYEDTNINNIEIDGQISNEEFSGFLAVDDPKMSFGFEGNLKGLSTKRYELKAILDINRFTPSDLGLNGDYANFNYSLQAIADIHASNIYNAEGIVNIKDIKISSSKSNYAFDNISLSVANDNRKSIDFKSDFAHFVLNGHYNYQTILSTIKSAPNALYPLFDITPVSTLPSNSDSFDFELTLSDHPFLHTIIKEQYQFGHDIHVKGYVDSKSNIFDLLADINSFNYGNHINLENILLKYHGENSNYSFEVSGLYPEKNKTYIADIKANGNANKIKSTVKWEIDQESPLAGLFNFDGLLTKENGQTCAHLVMQPSTVNLMDRQLNLSSKNIDIFKDHANINELQIEEGNKSLVINGILSNDSSDCLTADIKGTPIASLIDIVGGTATQFDGSIYGKCQVFNVLASPKIDANLTIQDITFREVPIGNAYILANWDNSKDGVNLHTQIINEENDDKDHITLVNGYIYPSLQQLDLKIDCNNTSSTFLNALIGRNFKNIKGNINGDISVSGDFKNFNILGEAYADTYLTLRATNATYRVLPEHKIRINSNSFSFDNITLSDKDNHVNTINGLVTHEKFKNFSYKFNMQLDNLLVYEEENFNNDKFKGKIYADGDFHLNGSDGHPLFINADISPAKGSEFSYDAATPDAITTNSFITFREIPPSDSVLIALGWNPSTYWADKDTANITTAQTNTKKYKGDIYMNIGIHMNHNCPIKLKMDNVDDGYITTYGSGVLQAEYYNKGAFTLNGTYNIEEGKYRLYLQDIIYRDLILQKESKVVFNGNPFAAEIHLICWHTLNSVPLSDLTSVSYTQNNRVKVICILDITGNLGNMAFNFDLNLPNVSDETRQIVRSYISTEEEMNKQLIYLLGFGRFFTNEYARANGENNTNQAVNNLLSSTLSGQINQILTNAIGSESKWNFGTGLSTGEKGWEDMDVEGTLSGKLLDDRLLINGNFGYRDNSLTNNSSFVGDFDVKWRLSENGNTYLKAYNLTNDRYFTKSTLNTQGVGATYQKDFENWKDLFRRKKRLKRKDKAAHDVTIPDTVGIELPKENDSILKFKNDTLNH